MTFREKMRNRGLEKSDLRLFDHVPIVLPELTDETTEEGRTYITPEGNRYPSITTVLSINSKDSIDRWKKRVGLEEAARISKTASERGTRIHNMCEDYLNNVYYEGKEIPDVANDRDNFKKIKAILDKNVGTIYALEVPLYSDELEIAGRTDLIAKWLGSMAVIDFKTSTKPKEEKWIQNYFQQGSGYCKMFEEQTGIAIETIVIIIAVDNHPAQIFVKNRDDYLPQLIQTREAYRNAYGR